jgi:UDP-N-acetylglucosamine transferase subunit ALG13
VIFVTVGTSFPFDRLVREVDRLVHERAVSDTVFAQVGIGGYRPRGFESVEVLDKRDFDHYFQRADAVIAHAGMGTISMALELGKPLLVMPRLRRYGELVNGHQEATARHFEKLGHVLVADDERELVDRIGVLPEFRPVPRSCHVEAVSRKVAEFIAARVDKSTRRKVCLVSGRYGRGH